METEGITPSQSVPPILALPSSYSSTPTPVHSVLSSSRHQNGSHDNRCYLVAPLVFVLVRSRFRSAKRCRAFWYYREVSKARH